MPRRLMLHAGGDVTSARPAMLEHLRGARSAVMIPYAQSDHDRATARFSDWLSPHGVEITGVHTAGDPAAALAGAEAIFVTGGNSFRLVTALHRLSLLSPVRSAIDRGIPYFGASAGANVACPTIRTTNDMPIVEPPSFVAFDLVPFQINPHYIDPPPPEARIGETREERLTEFLEENDVTVVALREQSWLAVDGPSMQVRGTGGAVLFRRGAEPRQLTGGTDLSWLLLETPRYDA
ncbi:MAG: dipeptidase PepE [Candidatus Dormiibacterota bacterium]